MKQDNELKMRTKPIWSLMLKLGLPMAFSMVLQALYNVVDTAFVINMGEDGQLANLALTYAFPIQILIIAFGVGTGIGINALLSRELGRKNEEGIKKTVGNGIFLGVILYLIFLIFGLFFARYYLTLQTSDEKVLEMGESYLRICCCCSFGSIGYSVFERFLQASGKTMYSTIAQISGAVTNIVLDYVFIYPLNMSVSGAAWATVIGQVVSLVVAMVFHYGFNKEVKNSIKALKPEWKTIKSIYQVGWSAILMQGLLSINMFVLTMIFGLSSSNAELIQGTYGIYYKIQQMALFAFFGMSNTIITLLSYSLGLSDEDRIKKTIRYGIIETLGLALVLTLLFEIFAHPIALLFGFASGEAADNIITLSETAIRLGSLSYLFMAFSIAIQGVLQAYRQAIRPLIISLLRLLVFVVPPALLFVYFTDAQNTVWWSFLIAEAFTALVAFFILRNHLHHEKISTKYVFFLKRE